MIPNTVSNVVWTFSYKNVPFCRISANAGYCMQSPSLTIADIAAKSGRSRISKCFTFHIVSTFKPLRLEYLVFFFDHGATSLCSRFASYIVMTQSEIRKIAADGLQQAETPGVDHSHSSSLLAFLRFRPPPASADLAQRLQRA